MLCVPFMYQVIYQVKCSLDSLMVTISEIASHLYYTLLNLYHSLVVIYFSPRPFIGLKFGSDCTRS